MLTKTISSGDEYHRHIGPEADIASFLHEMMGTSKHISQICQQVQMVAPTPLSVLIWGATGTGKEVIANALHRVPPYDKAPFVPVDCGSISPSLIESELFGHEKGAFTSAEHVKLGKFEIANGGTLFLDEISNLPLELQPKLLRALQEKQIFRVGGNQPIEARPRVIASSNYDLHALVLAEKFRRDLYHRLNEFCIVIAALRERKEDIEYLANRFLATANTVMKKNVTLSSSALQALLSYSWPGNVRELRNVIRRATLLAETEILPEHLYLADDRSAAALPPPDSDALFDGSVSLKEVVQHAVVEVERGVLTQVLRQARGNKARAARLLKVDYKTLHGKVRKYGISFARADATSEVQNEA
jgi:two-component system nitrogen regulation response regulator GlnG